MQIGTEMTIYTAAALKVRLLSELAASDALEIDLAPVADIDSAGLQLLLLARREATSAGKALRLIAPHGAVVEILATSGLSETFASSIVAAPTESGGKAKLVKARKGQVK